VTALLGARGADVVDDLRDGVDECHGLDHEEEELYEGDEHPAQWQLGEEEADADGDEGGLGGVLADVVLAIGKAALEVLLEVVDGEGVEGGCLFHMGHLIIVAGRPDALFHPEGVGVKQLMGREEALEGHLVLDTHGTAEAV